LRLIARLQESGFSLAGINQLLLAAEAGQSLGDVLGLEERVASTWGAEEPLRLRPDELAGRFPGGELSPELAQRSFALGLIALEGDQVVVRNPQFLEIGSELANLGVPMGELLDEYELLQAEATAIARRFTDVFERHLWARFAERGLQAEELAELIEMLQRLSALAEGIVEASLRQALKRAAGQFLAFQAPELEAAGALDTLRPLAVAAGLDLSLSTKSG
jgi:DNA-binding transcriptional MerR regulator